MLLFNFILKDYSLTINYTFTRFSKTTDILIFFNSKYIKL